MIKVIRPSWNFEEPTSSLILFHRQGVDYHWMKKSGSCFSREELDNLKPDPGTSLIQVNALGDFEFYGANRNGDAFLEKSAVFTFENPAQGNPKKLLIKCGNCETHDTFVKFGKVYREHDHNCVTKSFGPVIKSAHNDRMKRVELIIQVPNDLFRDELHKIANNRADEVAWSMSCKVPYDICSYCGNKAPSIKDYCPHLKDQMLSLTKSGNVICAINEGMKFFDISQVRKPADRTALTMRKVAGVAIEPSGGELAYLLGLKTPNYLFRDHPKTAAHLDRINKLAAIEKQIPVEINDSQELLERPNLTDEQLEVLKKALPDDVIVALNKRHVVLSLKGFLRLLGGDLKIDDDTIEEAEGLLPEVFSNAEDNDLDEVIPSPLEDCDCNSPNLGMSGSFLSRILGDLEDNYGISTPSLKKRITIISVSKPKKATKLAKTKKSLVSSSLAKKLASEYAKYQLRFLDCINASDEVMRRLVLGNQFSS